MGTKITYGEEWRARARAGEALDKEEQRRWAAEQEWETTCPDEVAVLERLVGRTVVTIRDLFTLDDRKLPEGLHLTIRCRIGDRLLGEASDVKLALRREWIRSTAVFQPRKEPLPRAQPLPVYHRVPARPLR